MGKSTQRLAVPEKGGRQDEVILINKCGKSPVEHKRQIITNIQVTALGTQKIPKLGLGGRSTSEPDLVVVFIPVVVRPTVSALASDPSNSGEDGL
jgi:hypothetical protein